MEFFENHNSNKINTINNLTFHQFKELYEISNLNSDKIKLKDLKEIYKQIKDYCKTSMLSNYNTKKLYRYSNTTNTGRLFGLNSIQSIPKFIRGYLCNELATDIDICNCHPVILKYICGINNINCPHLSYYIENRERIIVNDRERLKTLYLISLYSDKINRKEQKNELFHNFDLELKQIQNTLFDNPTYQHLKTDTNIKNPKGSFLCNIICYFENQILQKIISYINYKNIQIFGLCFDGLLIYGNYYNNIEFLNDICKEINKDEFENLNIKLTYKEHLNIIGNYLENTNDTDEEEFKLEYDYNDIVIEFEKTHAKIINKSCYIKYDPINNTNILMSHNEIIQSYNHMIFQQIEETNGRREIKEYNFIKKWIYNNVNIRKYQDIGLYPNTLMCPENIYNLWTPFKNELIQSYNHHQDGLDFFLNHINIMCNKEPLLFDYVIKWISHMIKFPYKKSGSMLVFIGAQGTGKSSLILLLKQLIDEEKVFETTNPSRDVWGNFNSIISNKYLINLNELNRKQTLESDEFLKSLITDNTITINQKGKQAYTINSYHRFITTTNNYNAFTTSRDDRRKVFINCSNELKNNNSYFNNFYHYLNDRDVIKTLFEFFKSIDINENFNIPIPNSEFQNDIIENNEDIEIRFLKDYIIPIKLNEIKIPCNEIYREYTRWCSIHNLNYIDSSIKFFKYIQFNDNIPKHLIEKGRTNLFRYYKLNIEELKKYYNISEDQEQEQEQNNEIENEI